MLLLIFEGFISVLETLFVFVGVSASELEVILIECFALMVSTIRRTIPISKYDFSKYVNPLRHVVNNSVINIVVSIRSVSDTTISINGTRTFSLIEKDIFLCCLRYIS